MREDFWPFVSACAVVVCSSLLVAAYAVKRTWFTDQKVDYGSYEEGNQRVQHEMEMVRQQSQDAAGYQNVNLNDQVEPQSTAPVAPTANPFQQKASNPFQGSSNPFNN